MSKINELTALDAVVAGDLLAVWSTSNGDTRKAALSVLLTYIQANITLTTYRPVYATQHAAPLTGATVAVTDSSASTWLIISPAGTIATLTITLPANANLVDKQEVNVFSTQIITTLTVGGNGTSMAGNPTTIAAANGYFTMRYDATADSWYRVG